MISNLLKFIKTRLIAIFFLLVLIFSLFIYSPVSLVDEKGLTSKFDEATPQLISSYSYQTTLLFVRIKIYVSDDLFDVWKDYEKIEKENLVMGLHTLTSNYTILNPITKVYSRTGLLLGKKNFFGLTIRHNKD